MASDAFLIDLISPDDTNHEDADDAGDQWGLSLPYSSIKTLRIFPSKAITGD